jgi:hypothetical protein
MPGIGQFRAQPGFASLFSAHRRTDLPVWKPFKHSKGVERLPIEMVPEELLDLHNDLITIRDKLYAHSDADKSVTLGALHFGELRAYRYKYPKPEGGYFIDRLQIAPKFFSNAMAKLVEVMVEKTQYHVDLLEKKFARRIPHRDGEFLLNIKDEDGPIFTKVEPVQGPRSDSV